MAIADNLTGRPHVLKKASARAASALGITRPQLARILGIDEASLDAPLEPAGKSGQRALQVIRIYLHLQALTGNDSTAITHWMQTKSRCLGSSPVDRMQTVDGLKQTLTYLESFRQ